ncbi:MAG: glucosyl-3-phosphoglycerate synthase [Acidimicrobiales bacterium]
MPPGHAPLTLGLDDVDVDATRRAKASTTVAVVVPARDEVDTIGAVLDAARALPGLVDELIVVDDHSTDDTAAVATRHDARVVTLGGVGGKGAAMAAGVAATAGDLVVFLDADVTNPAPDYVARLIAPLIHHPRIQLVKGFYVRPLHDMPTGGGRVNDLTARPVLSLLFPGVGEIRQPLAGETAVRRSVLDALDLELSYDVEIALLIDVAARCGVDSLAQVDLGVRRHRNRPLDELRPMAVDVLRAALTRYGVAPPGAV